MRLLFIQNVAPHDARAFGGQRIHHELTKAMARRGHDARGVFLTADGEAPELDYPSWGVRETGRLQLDARTVRRALPAIFGSWSPDVLYGAAAESAPGLEWAAGRCLRAATSHHYDPPVLDAGSPLRPLRWLRAQRRLQRFALERRMLRAAEVVIATSAFGAAALKERGYIDANVDVPVLHNGVADSWFDVSSAGATGFVFVGRMDDQKGVDVLLEALRLRQGRWPVTLVGGGWMEQRYRDRASELGVSEQVRFLGQQTHEDGRRLCAEAAAFVLPSRAENCPLVLLEAMAAGLAVVSTDVGGIPELATHEQTALLVRPEDAAELAASMDRVERDATLRRSLSEGGRVVADGQRWDRVAERLEHILEARIRP